jgi:hypothetical protein
VDYAPIIDGYGRTRASPGRYVPAIGKRLVDPSKGDIGWHPGSRKTPFSQRTYDRLSAWVDQKISEIDIE